MTPTEVQRCGQREVAGRGSSAKSVLWLTVIALLFAACGDDGEAVTTTGAPTTQPTEQTTQAPQTTQPTEQTTQAPVETTEAPMEKQPFVIAVPGDIENLDGMGTYTQFAAQVWFHTHGRLMRFKELPSPTAPGSIVLDKNTPEPELAESLVTEDFRTWTLTLREGLVFPSGNSLTTDDVIYSFDRAISLAGSPGFLLNTAGITDIGQVEKIDDTRLRITVPKPNKQAAQDFRLGGRSHHGLHTPDRQRHRGRPVDNRVGDQQSRRVRTLRRETVGTR